MIFRGLSAKTPFDIWLWDSQQSVLDLISNMQSYLVCGLNVNLNLQIEITEILTTTVHICGTQWYFGQETWKDTVAR